MATSKHHSMFLLTIFITLFIYSGEVRSAPSYKNLPVPVLGPHSFAFDSLGRGPYTSVSDGRILFYQRSRNRFVDFAYTSPNRTRAECDGLKTLTLLSKCGRALSLSFSHGTKKLYIADATLGLFVVGRKGGRATQIAASVNGVPIRFTASVDVDRLSDNVYFTDGSSTGGIDEIPLIVSIRDATGRLLKYDPKTKKVQVLLNEISGAAGVAVSKDGSYLLLSEFIGLRIRKYWLKGPKAYTAEVILNVEDGYPDNIRRTASGDFWVAVTSPKGQPLGVRINGLGTILEMLTFSPQFVASTIAVVQQYRDSLYLGSLEILIVMKYCMQLGFNKKQHLLKQSPMMYPMIHHFMSHQV